MGRLALHKKINVFREWEGWQDCYLLVTPVTYAEQLAFKEMDTNISEEEGVEKTRSFVKSHIAGGKVMIVEDGELKQVDYDNESDFDDLALDMIMDLFEEMIGVKFDDPKVLKQATLAAKSQSESESATETQ